jgi:MOSC domain-containing protein YiiM
MELLAVSIGQPRYVEHRGRGELTGIYKSPVAGPVAVTPQGLEGDGQADLKNHGGVDKALYAYTLENYRFWEGELGLPELPFGQFGENLTVTGMPDEAVHIGDVFRIGEIVVQVTQPRVPCHKLGIRFELPQFPARFLPSGRCGFYLRVLQTGVLRAGDAIERLREDPARLNLADGMLAIQDGPRQQEIIRRALDVEALSAAWRDDLTRRIQG